MKMRGTSAMIAACPLFLRFSSNPCELNRSKQTARCRLPNDIRPNWSAQTSARIAQPFRRNAKTPKSTCATDTLACANKSLCESRAEETGRPARVGRSSGSAATAGRPAPPYSPLRWRGSFRSQAEVADAREARHQWVTTTRPTNQKPETDRNIEARSRTRICDHLAEPESRFKIRPPACGPQNSDHFLVAVSRQQG